MASNDRICTQHVLLGLLRENDGLAAELIREQGLNLVEIRRGLQENSHDDSRDEKFVREDHSLPPDIAELLASAESVRKRIEEAIARHDFAAAKAYSDEEGTLREKLFSLYRQHGMNDWIYG
jgi:ATP-dependent Clp protease ATP-binding subunit ClpA